MNEVRAHLLGGIPDTEVHRQRLLASSKRLMAARGYEGTTLEAIARDTGVPVDMLLAEYKSKDALLEAVFNEAWEPLNSRLGDIVVAAVNMREAVMAMLTAFLHALGKDREFTLLLLFESRRQHGNNAEIRLSRGFMEFERILTQVFLRGQKDGSFSPQLEPYSTTSALLGAAEGMLRDRVLAEMLGHPIPFSEPQLRSTFDSIISRLAH